MTPVELSRTVLRAVCGAVEAGELSVSVPERIVVERPRPGGRGDYATAVALQLARPAGRAPRHVAEILRSRLLATSGIAEVDISGPGFLNIAVDAPGRTLVREILRCGHRYGHRSGPPHVPPARPGPRPSEPHEPVRETSSGRGGYPGRTSTARGRGPGPVRLHVARGVRAAVVADALARILRSQGTAVWLTRDSALDPGWSRLGVTGAAYGDDARAAVLCRGPATATSTGRGPGPAGAREKPTAHRVRPVPVGEDPLFLGRDAARWALLHPAAHDRARVTEDHLVQRESNPLFRVRYAHARSQALVRNAAALGFHAEPGDLADPVTPSADTASAPAAPVSAQVLLATLASYPVSLTAAARHHAPDRLARYLVGLADDFLRFQGAVRVLPFGDEKPSAAHRARLALAEAAGTVLAGGLDLLGIDAPDLL